MPISIPSFCMAVKDAESCRPALEIATSIQMYFRSKAMAMVLSGNRDGIPATFTIGDLQSPKEIGKYFKEHEADLLILPMIKGKIGDWELTASDVNTIIDKIERMVLTVPCGQGSFDLSNIVVPLDTSFETRQKVPYAVAFAKAFRATLHVIGVSGDKGKDAEVLVNNYVRQVCNNIEEKGVTYTREIRLGGNPTDTIIEFAKEKKAGLITIMTEQETNLVSFFTGKYSQQMIKNSPVPVLSIHPKDLIISDARL